MPVLSPHKTISPLPRALEYDVVTLQAPLRKMQGSTQFFLSSLSAERHVALDWKSGTMEGAESAVGSHAGIAPQLQKSAAVHTNHPAEGLKPHPGASRWG